ncbi:CaiB/BaiF CoA-transferase family protein [Niveispirillum sp.]|uniref:CaiB/BaiF CoA transferase family protein n=1 Tax=Niveispirillum sp. TaxID=1917217 RepID=UPI001B799F3B|nr:CaiB/BaiF CoA-transferase family protein [Niveispirillum sp.]MBP7336859.1 CoA transferase [Niveispirillum sp.]
MTQTQAPQRTGPLAGVRVLEFAGIGPGPYCAMLLSDLGAEVLRIDRAGGNGWPNPVMDRGRANLTLDIRSPAGRERCLEAALHADVLIEGFRPGVMERLGLGPDVLCDRNPRLIYGRMTGWGQEGPLARAAGHDINYIALTGALAAVGPQDGPATPPLNLVGDFGGGSLFLALGIVSALWERERSGRGQVVDAAIVDGVTSMMAMFSGLVPAGHLSLDRDRSVLGGAAPFYRCYRCADGKEISVGPLEPHFYKELLDRLGAPADLYADQDDPSLWPARSLRLVALFATRTRAEWVSLLEGTDACFAPVLTLDEVMDHPHMASRGAYREIDGIRHCAPAPRLSRTPPDIGQTRDGETVLAGWLGSKEARNARHHP